MFDLKTGVVKNPRSATVFPMPGIGIELVNAWSKISLKEDKKSQLELLDRNKQKFDWYNY